MNNLEKTFIIHKDQIQTIVAETLDLTFKTYFNIDIFKSSQNKSLLKEGVFCQTIIKDPSNNAIVLITFEEPFLREIASIVYPPSEASKKESFESCATEIANIVSVRVKTYLNESGYDLETGIPSIVDSTQLTTEDIQISFFIDKSRLFVDIGFKPELSTQSFNESEPV